MAQVQLRPLKEADEIAIVAMLSSSQVAKTYMLPDFASDAEAVKLFKRLMALSQGEETYLRGGYDGDELVGFINQVSVEGNTVEVGYVVAPDKWNRGYGTAMLTAAMEELFRRGWQTVRAGYFEGNIASRRVMEKSGMESIDFSDTVEYRGVIHPCHYLEKHK